MLIQDRITRKTYELYGVVKNNDSKSISFVIWEDKIEEFVTRNSLDFCPVNLTPAQLRQSQTRNNPIPNIGVSTNRSVYKCANEKKRTSTYVSCARCDIPVALENCSPYCPKYTPIY